MHRPRSIIDMIIDANNRVDDARGVIEALSVDGRTFPLALDEFEAALFARQQIESLRG